MLGILEGRIMSVERRRCGCQPSEPGSVQRWAEYGRAHAEFFGEEMPATTLIEVKALIDPAMLIEIEADASV
jgi:hypothetical protein